MTVYRSDDQIDEFGLYMEEINAASLLPHDDEARLIADMLAGREAQARLEARETSEALHEAVERGREARQRLIESNVFLVINIARRYVQSGIALPDLVQEGNLGLIEAIDRFDAAHGTRLSTYATYWIRHRVSRFVAANRHPLRLPGHQSARIAHLKRLMSEAPQRWGRNPSVEELAQEMGIPVRSVQETLSVVRTVVELSDDRDDEDGPSWSERVAVDALSPEGELEEYERRMLVNALLDYVSPREALILRLRYGLDGEEPHTLQAIADRLGLTKERIRQIEKQALRVLHSLAQRQGLYAYVA